MAEAILDASALLALINQETGADKVAKVMPIAAMSSVNFSEVATILHSIGMPIKDIKSALQNLVEIIPFSEEHAWVAAELHTRTKKKGLSLGDRACFAVALALRLPVFTADRVWAELDLGVRVNLIR